MIFYISLIPFVGKWEEADQSIRQLASSDRWESQILKAEMYYLKGDPTEALESLYDILDYCKTEDDSLHFVSLRVKAMILMSQVQHSFSNIQSTNIMLLNEALWLAKGYHLHYLAATAEMNLANVQLSMGCAKNALSLVRKALPTIMADGSAFDMARGKVEQYKITFVFKINVLHFYDIYSTFSNVFVYCLYLKQVVYKTCHIVLDVKNKLKLFYR